MRRHIPTITKVKQAGDIYSKQRGGSVGVAAWWNLGSTATHPTQTSLNGVLKSTNAASGPRRVTDVNLTSFYYSTFAPSARESKKLI